MSVPQRVGFYPQQASIDAYGDGGFRFAGMSHRGSILALPSGIHAWDVAEMGDLRPEHFAQVAQEARQIEVLFLGTGLSVVLPSALVRTAVEDAGVGLEVMSTGAAARTYNILLAERRRVAAALLAVA